MNKILEFDESTEIEEAAAQRLSSEKFLLGHAFFAYNLPLQIWLPSKDDIEEAKENGTLPDAFMVNYMPRKQECNAMDLSELGISYQDKDTMKDLCNVTISILKNLTRQWERFRDGKQDYVYYPNEKTKA